MSKVSAFRKMLREEIAFVLKQELPKILEESKKAPQYKETLKKQVESKVPPATLNVGRAPKLPVPKTGNSVLNSILLETASTMMQNDISHYANVDVDGLSILQEQSYEAQTVSNVDQMLASANRSSAHEMIQVNAVPDFNHLMDKLISKGEI